MPTELLERRGSDCLTDSDWVRGAITTSFPTRGCLSTGSAWLGAPASPVASRGLFATTPSRERPRGDFVQQIVIPSFSGDEIVLYAAAPLPPWSSKVLEAVVELLDLPPGWDSYGARPLSPECVAESLEFMLNLLASSTPPPAAVPTSCGGIQYEWHRGNVDLEIEFSPASPVRAFYENHATGATWEEDVTDHSERLIHALSVLSATV